MSDFLLRVKKNSQVHKVLEKYNNEPIDPEKITETTGKSYFYWIFNTFLRRNFDNVRIDKVNDGRILRYKEPLTSVVSIAQPISQPIQTTHSDEEDIQTDNMQWPSDAPVPQPIKSSDWDNPSYFQTMEKMVLSGRHISLEGPPSVGKDTAVVQLAALHNKPLVTIGGDAGFRVRDLVGTTHISNGHSCHIVGDYVAAVVNGWWVLMTEVNAADPSALMYINRQLASPYVVNLGGKSYPVHPNFRLFVTYNNGLIGTRPLPQSFKDRFFSIKVPFFTGPALRRRLTKMGMPVVADDPAQHTEKIVAFGVALWDAYERGQIRYQITTRRLIDASYLIFSCGEDVRSSLRAAVIDAIDNPLETQAAERILLTVMNS